MFTTKVIKGKRLACTCHVGMFKIIAIHAATDFYANNLLRRYTQCIIPLLAIACIGTYVIGNAH